MKRVLTPIIALALLAGCSKNPISLPDEDNTDGKHLLEFTIDGFTQQLIPFADQIKALSIQASADRSALSPGSIKAETIPGTLLRDHINAIEIKIYQTGLLVDSIRQYADDPKFGTYSAYHQKETSPFQVFIAAAQLGDDGDIEMRRGVDNKGLLADHYIKTLPEPSDAYFSFSTISLTQGTSNRKIQLKRFVGRLEINLKEEIPAATHHMEVRIENTAQYFLLSEQRGYRVNKDVAKDTIAYETVKVINIKPEDRGKPSFEINAYFVKQGLLTGEAETTTVTLNAFDAENNLLKSKIIPNVQIQTNMRTKLTGFLFAAPNLNFDMEIVSAWNTSVPEILF